MQNKKMIFGLVIVVVLVGAAAFVAGRLLNQGVGPMGLRFPASGGDAFSISVQITPAAELPKERPEIRGIFVSRDDNSIVLATVSMDAGGKGIVVKKSSGGGESVSGSPMDDSGPKVEVVTTGDTTIYKETTDFPHSPPSGDLVLQQTVGEASLDDLTSQSFVTVWGRKSGDRIIADVVFISNPVIFKKPQ